MCCKNEDWIAGLSLRAALMWNDFIVVLLHSCTDRSAEIVVAVSGEFPGRVHVLTESSAEWEEMRHRQRMLDAARALGATHISIVDLDEVLTGNLLPTIRQAIERIPAGAELQLPWICLARAIDRYYVDGVWSMHMITTAFQDGPECHWARRNGYDFHQRPPMGRPCRPYSPVPSNRGGLMHLQFVSEHRLRAKQALYQMTEVLRWPGRKSPTELAVMYGRAVYESDPGHFQANPVPAEWWEPYRSLLGYLKPDEEPWQETEMRRLIEIHGRQRFAGLDLFGVV